MEKWFLKNKRGDASALADALSISPAMARILINRDIDTAQKVEIFLNGNLQGLHKPELLKDGEKAAAIIKDMTVTAFVPRSFGGVF